jgi:hypothetical protein
MSPATKEPRMTPSGSTARRPGQSPLPPPARWRRRRRPQRGFRGLLPRAPFQGGGGDEIVIVWASTSSSRDRRRKDIFPPPAVCTHRFLRLLPLPTCHGVTHAQRARSRSAASRRPRVASVRTPRCEAYSPAETISVRPTRMGSCKSVVRVAGDDHVDLRTLCQ